MVVIWSVTRNDVYDESVIALYDALLASIFDKYNSEIVVDPI